MRTRNPKHPIPIGMATSGLLALIDDIASVLDDIALLTKVASKKAGGVLGDDLALNAQQVSGLRAERELPVVWAVAKGSAINKLILVPAALTISEFAAWAVTPLLMFGGLFLCYEGVEKLARKWLFKPEDDAAAHRALLQTVADPAADLVAFERVKVKGAIRTDLVLSAEIVAIALGTVAAAPFITRFGVLAAVAAIMTVGVYGFVAAIVKLDDLGLYLARFSGHEWHALIRRGLGALILRAAPLLMKFLSVAGTIAMFLVGGGILMHGLTPLQDALNQTLLTLGGAGPAGALLRGGLPLLFDAFLGLVAGVAALATVSFLGWLARRGRFRIP